MPALELSTAARHSFARLRRGNRRQADRVRAALAQLRAGTQPTGARRLTGNRTGQCRLTVGELRVVYEPAGETVRVLTIAYRRSSYGAGHSN